MILPVDDNLFQSGFCGGVYEVTVDGGPRIRLPRAVIHVLLDRGVGIVWVYPDPTGPRLILCPDRSRRAYMKVAQENLPKSSPAGKAYREFICAGRPIALRDHGWISVASFHSEGFTAGADDSVVIVGTGLWYELWRQDDWFTSEEAIGK